MLASKESLMRTENTLQQNMKSESKIKINTIWAKEIAQWIKCLLGEREHPSLALAAL